MKAVGGDIGGNAAFRDQPGETQAPQASNSNGQEREKRPSLFVNQGLANAAANSASKARPGRALWRSGDDIVGSSAAISRVRELIALYAPENDPVLIVGETGVGKEAVARQIHKQGPRGQRDLVVRNVGRIDRDLAGADFFGHARGAYTGAADKRTGLFEQAHHSSLHLDEIGELPIELQANLLRVLEDGVVTPLGAAQPVVVDVRIIAATNARLADATATGAFRKDLYYRLATLEIELPPLRDREDDAVEIAIHMVRQLENERSVSLSLSQRALDAIRAHRWPGNVRELRNSLRRAAIHVRNGVIDSDDLAIARERPRTAELVVARVGPAAAVPTLRDANVLLERFLTARALEHSEGVVQAAARLIEMNREKCGEINRWLESNGATSGHLRDQLRRLLGV